MVLKKITFLLSLLIAMIHIVACQDAKSKYYADDIEIFKNSPVWKLAKAIDKHDIKEAEKLLNKHPDWVDYQDSKFGVTLLYWCFLNSPSKRSWEEYYYEEAKLLIEYGANPYLKDGQGGFPLLKAAEVYKGSTKFIQLCLNSKHTAKLPDSTKRFFINEALLVACGRVTPEELESVKLLVEAGGDINYFSSDSTKTPFMESITKDNMNVAKYLVIEKGADYDIYVKRMVDGVRLSMLKRLLDLDYSKQPKKQKIKEDIVHYIEEQRSKK